VFESGRLGTGSDLLTIGVEDLRAAVSAARNCGFKDGRIAPIVIAELELGDIEGHVLAAHLVEGADNAALEDRPEALNRVGVNRADDVLVSRMVDGAVV
jgi:hypothetical protein